MQDSTPNPYVSPKDESAAQSGTGLCLFSPGQIAWATFLGAPLGGSILLALNYRRMNNASSANLALAGGAAVTILLMIVAFWLPDNFPSSAMPIACVVAMYQTAKALQGASIAHNFVGGGAKASSWLATGIGFLSVVVILAVVFAVLMMLPAEWIE